MGSDKGLLETEAKTWAQSAANKLLAARLPVFYSVNPEQWNAYSSIFPSEQLIKDSEDLSVNGPLLGVLSAHLQMPAEDFFVLACDMPLMNSSIIDKLKSAEEKNEGYDAYLFTNAGEPEPLSAIYKAVGLARILSMYRSNQLKRHSMKFMLDHLKVYALQIEDEEKQYFRNVNSHAELKGL